MVCSSCLQARVTRYLPLNDCFAWTHKVTKAVTWGIQTVRLWNVESGVCIRCIEVAAPVNAISFYLYELEGKRTVEKASVLNPCQVLVKLSYDFDGATNRHTICVAVTKGRHIPRMESPYGIDTYVVAQLGEESERSETALKSSDPVWNFVTMFSPSNLDTPLLVKIFRYACLENANFFILDGKCVSESLAKEKIVGLGTSLWR